MPILLFSRLSCSSLLQFATVSTIDKARSPDTLNVENKLEYDFTAKVRQHQHNKSD